MSALARWAFLTVLLFVLEPVSRPYGQAVAAKIDAAVAVES